MPHPTIQDLARRAKSAHHNYGQTDAATERLMLDVLDAIIGPDGKARAIDVDPGTLTEYAGVGIAINCDYNSDASGRQPFVTINTEELDSAHRYGANANLVMERDGLVKIGGGGAGDRVQALNAEIDRQSGMPKIAVHLNDVELYDDNGHGNMASVVGAPTVYVVNPNFPDDTAAVFADFDDATSYAETFDSEPHVEEQSVADHAMAREMIADRTDDDPDYATLLADPELSEQARETLREQARAAGEEV